MTPLKITHRIGHALIRAGKTLFKSPDVAEAPSFGVGGYFTVTHLAKDGTVKGVHLVKNGVTNEGLNRILNTMFDGTTQIAAGGWYLGLISSSSYSALAAGDDYDGIGGANGWTEFTSYDESTRVSWNPAASSAQSSSNASTCDFTISASGTVKGIFLASVSTKGDGTAGANNVLWATGLFPSGDQVVADDDVLKITYTVNAAAA